ncbi:hypothetical protein N9W84_00770 [bacterium]|nr:hypothetical protein [bacterium]
MDNPYLLRQALLDQATQIANTQYHSKMEEYKTKVGYCLSINKDPSEVEMPLAPTDEDIINIAKKLYTFVKTK